MSSQESCYISLLGLAEHFRTLSPPDISKCIQCLQAVLTSKLPPKVKARTHFQIGHVLFTYTKNVDIAIRHLEHAWMLCYSSNVHDDFMFEAASALAILYEQQGIITSSISILNRSIERSQHSVVWHCRLLFQLAQIFVSEGMYESACGLLGIGVDYSKLSSDKYNEVLFLTSQCMVFLIDKNFPEGLFILEQIDYILGTWGGDYSQKTYLEGYFLVLKVCYYMMLGRMKTAEPYLKRLQVNALDVMSLSPDMVEIEFKNGTVLCWMPKKHLRVLVHALTFMHHMQGGCVNKAVKYAEKTLVELEKLRTANKSVFLVFLEVMCIENLVMCNIVGGYNSKALTLISNACSLCSSHPKLLMKHRPQLHALLGLYAMSMDFVTDAEKQFKVAVTMAGDEELKTFLNLNLAVLFVKGRRLSEMNQLLAKINPANFPSRSQSLKAVAYMIFGVLELIEGRYDDGTKFLKETVKMANAEYARRLTFCSLVLLGNVLLIQDRRQECLAILTTAMELSSPTCDVRVQLQALSILMDLHQICSDSQRQAEFSLMHFTLSQKLMMDHLQATNMPEHSLIYWTTEDPPPLSSLKQI